MSCFAVVVGLVWRQSVMRGQCACIAFSVFGVLDAHFSGVAGLGCVYVRVLKASWGLRRRLVLLRLLVRPVGQMDLCGPRCQCGPLFSSLAGLSKLPTVFLGRRDMPISSVVGFG